MPDNGFEETDFDDIGDALEEHEDRDSKMAEAYRRWEEDGDKEMLENLTSQFHVKHALDTKDQLQKKGGRLDYDERDAGLAGAIITALSILAHPILLTFWIGALIRIYQHSKRDIDSTKDFWTRLDQFGFEIYYFVTYSVVVAYLLISVGGKEVLLSNFPTALRMGIQVMQFAGF